MSLGENIIRLRGEKNLSQERLAAELEVSRQAVSKWETNTSVPELDKLLRMSELFGVALDELVKGASTSAASQGKTMPVTETEIAHETVVVERQAMSARMVIGVLLLCFGGLLLILLLVRGYGALAFLFATPFFLTSVPALAVKQHTALVVEWLLWAFAFLTINWLTGSKLSLRVLLYSGGSIIGVMCWAILLWLAVLVVMTVRVWQKRKK